MLRRLEWDSEFFKLKIGRLDLDSVEEFSEIILKSEELRQSFDLLYIFAEETLNQQLLDINLVDTKTIFTKQLIDCPKEVSGVSKYLDSVVSQDLYHLAWVSGKYSRFQLDKRFPDDAYERLYGRWIEQSVAGNMADSVFVHGSDGRMDGMITIGVEGREASIGLVAVDDLSQGKGIGSKLIQAVEEYLLRETQVNTLKVATQWENKAACRLYEKNGFEVESKTNIYHWWL